MIEFLNTQFTRVLIMYIFILVTVALFLGKMTGTEAVTVIVSLASGYIAKRANEQYQERKNAELKT